MKATVVTASVLVIVLLGASSQTSAEIVNGGFEMGLSPGWSQNQFIFRPAQPGYGNAGIGWVLAPSEGVHAANLWAESHATSSNQQVHDENWASLTQTFSATAGQSVSFDYFVPSCITSGSGLGVSGAYLKATLSGVGYQKQFIESSSSSGYDSYAFPAFASDGTYTATFQAYTAADVFGNGEYHAYVNADIDNVRLVPEPATLVLLVVGGIGLPACAWRRRNHP
jgi:hypothetical protein